MQSALQKSAGTVSIYTASSQCQENAIDSEIRCLLQVASTTEHQHGSRAPQVNWGLLGNKACNATTSSQDLDHIQEICLIWHASLIGHR
jgi:hypothetical protein